MRTLLGATIALTLALIACAPAAPMDVENTVAQGAHPIVNGVADTTHEAVVAVIADGAICSGTIVEVSGGDAYVLTAAHCVDGMTPDVVLQGDDYNGSPVTYPVADWLVHPNFNHPYFDFAMLRATGAGPGTPKIPAIVAAEDTVAAGTPVDLVGYGQTENGANSVRRHVTLPVADATGLLLLYDQVSSGMCFGDSGGGDIFKVGGQDRVVGVNQGVESVDCVGGIGVAGRVSAVTGPFIVPFIQGDPVEPQTCGQCFEAQVSAVGQCAAAVDACSDHPDCAALVECAQACQTQVCNSQCVAAHPVGYQVYKDINECVCAQGCVVECESDSICPKAPACGFTSTTAACQTCFEQSCCAQMQACAADHFCAACFMKTPPEGCDDSALYAAAKDCLATSCDAECLGGPFGEGGGGAGSGGGGAGVAGAGGEGGGGAAVGGGPATGGGKKKEGRPASEGGCALVPLGGSPAAGFAALALGLAALCRRPGRRCIRGAA